MCILRFAFLSLACQQAKKQGKHWQGTTPVTKSDVIALAVMPPRSSPNFQKFGIRSLCVKCFLGIDSFFAELWQPSTVRHFPTCLIRVSTVVSPYSIMLFLLFSRQAHRQHHCAFAVPFRISRLPICMLQIEFMQLSACNWRHAIIFHICIPMLQMYHIHVSSYSCAFKPR